MIAIREETSATCRSIRRASSMRKSLLPLYEFIPRARSLQLFPIYSVQRKSVSA